MPDPAARTRGVALGVVSACSYGLGPVVIKVALEDMSTWTLLLYRLLLALGLGVGGVAVVATASGELRAEPLGIVPAVGSAIAYAAVVLGTNAYSVRIAPLPLSVVLATGAAMMMVVVAPVADVGTSGAASGWLLVVAIPVLVGVAGQTALLAGVALIGPSLTSILLTLEPLVALLLAWLALGEHLSALQLAGGGLILAAALVAHRAAAEPVPGAALA